MKANNGKGNNVSRDDWETPKWLYKLLNEQYNFNFDCCAEQNNTKCLNWSNDLENTAISIDFVTWMNPPFSKAKEMFERFFKMTLKGVAIYRCDNLETSIWQTIIFPLSDWIFIPDKRISYIGKDGSGSRFPSALIGKGVEPPKNIKGTTLNTGRKDK